MTALFRQRPVPAASPWRDHFLTWLTALMLFHLFVVSPLELYPNVWLRATAAFSMAGIAVCLLVLARGIVPVPVIALLIVLLGLAVVLQIGGNVERIALYTRVVAWLFIAFVVIWVVVRAVYAPGPITYHRIVGAVMLYITIGMLFASLYVLLATMVPGAVNGASLVPHASRPRTSCISAS